VGVSVVFFVRSVMFRFSYCWFFLWSIWIIVMVY